MNQEKKGKEGDGGLQGGSRAEQKNEWGIATKVYVSIFPSSYAIIPL